MQNNDVVVVCDAGGGTVVIKPIPTWVTILQLSWLNKTGSHLILREDGVSIVFGGGIRRQRYAMPPAKTLSRSADKSR